MATRTSRKCQMCLFTIFQGIKCQEKHLQHTQRNHETISTAPLDRQAKSVSVDVDSDSSVNEVLRRVHRNWFISCKIYRVIRSKNQMFVTICKKAARPQCAELFLPAKCFQINFASHFEQSKSKPVCAHKTQVVSLFSLWSSTTAKPDVQFHKSEGHSAKCHCSPGHFSRNQLTLIFAQPSRRWWD